MVVGDLEGCAHFKVGMYFLKISVMRKRLEGCHLCHQNSCTVVHREMRKRRWLNSFRSVLLLNVHRYMSCIYHNFLSGRQPLCSKLMKETDCCMLLSAYQLLLISLFPEGLFGLVDPPNRWQNRWKGLCLKDAD